MTREEKVQLVEELTDKLSATDYFYITDASGMTVAQINSFRKMCFDKGLEYKVFKNTLVRKALENLETDYNDFSDAVLKGFTGIIFSPEAGNLPAKLLKDFRKKSGLQKPLLKGASIDTATYIGEDQLETLTTIKSKFELIADVIGLLQSPAKNVISGLQSGGQKLSGILKTLSEREEN